MTMKKPLVSIIVPTYNREKIIQETLDCAVNQDYENIEIIVVDNCSTDKTFEILQQNASENPKVKIFRNDSNLGPVKNWEKAISLASGKYTKILWSDDKISTNFISATVPFLEQDNDIGFIYTQTEIFWDNKSEYLYSFGKTGKYLSRDFIRAHLTDYKTVPVSPGCALFRTDDLKLNLVIDISNDRNLDFKRYGAGNDLLLYLITANTYSYFYYLDNLLSFFRAHKDSFSIANDLSEYYTYSKHYFIQKYLDTSFKDYSDYFYYMTSKNNKLSSISHNVAYSKSNAIIQRLRRRIANALFRLVKLFKTKNN